MGSRSKRLFILYFCIVFLLSGTTFATNSRQESDGFFLWGGESHPIRIGYVSSGEVIHGSYSSDGSSIEFFIVDEGNYSRWVDNLTYDRHSYKHGVIVSFNFTVPYNDTWYAIFHNPNPVLFDYVDYEIRIGFPRPANFEPILAIAGIAVAVIIGMAILIKVKSSRAETPLAERLTERTTEIAYEEETVFEEVTAESHEPVLGNGLVCSFCGHENPSDAEFCVECGRELK